MIRAVLPRAARISTRGCAMRASAPAETSTRCSGSSGAARSSMSTTSVSAQSATLRAAKRSVPPPAGTRSSVLCGSPSRSASSSVRTRRPEGRADRSTTAPFTSTTRCGESGATSGRSDASGGSPCRLEAARLEPPQARVLPRLVACGREPKLRKARKRLRARRLGLARDRAGGLECRAVGRQRLACEHRAHATAASWRTQS